MVVLVRAANEDRLQRDEDVTEKQGKLLFSLL